MQKKGILFIERLGKGEVTLLDFFYLKFRVDGHKLFPQE